jgi:kexin
MRLPFSLILVLLVHQSISSTPPLKRSYSTHDYFVLEHIPSLGGASLHECTSELGVELVDRVGELRDFWLVRSAKVFSTIQPRSTHDGVLARYKNLRSRAAAIDASPLQSRSDGHRHARRIISAINHFEEQLPRQRTKRAPPPIKPADSDSDPNSSAAIAARLGFVDPLFTQQWHIVNDEFPEHMMNVTAVWEMGITGRGVIASLVDDGLDYKSKDLAENFVRCPSLLPRRSNDIFQDAEHSYDFNDHTDLPTPVLSDDRHGTRCAGQIAAAKNDACGVGLAYGSKVAGIRILSGPITDVDEAAALNYGFQDVSIYSCSWGPPDDGKSMEGPGYLIQKAFLNGIQNGRDGKGSVFVFASGNGAGFGDQCNFDGYTNSIYSVTVSAVDYKGLHPYYSEPCAANMVVAYSSGSGKNIVSGAWLSSIIFTAIFLGYHRRRRERLLKQSRRHLGRSSKCSRCIHPCTPSPVSLLFAGSQSTRLTSHATSPDLTWRDIQHLCVQTAQVINPEDPDWEKTASGRPFSYKYGYGQLNGYAFVTAAQNWELVKPQAWFHPSAIRFDNGSLLEEEGEMTGGVPIVPGGVSSTFTVTEDMLQEHNLEAIEHLTIRVWISHTKRGDVEVELMSPNGVRSVLAAVRNQDHAHAGFRGWRFMTIKHWYVFAYYQGNSHLSAFKGRESHWRLDDQSLRPVE